MPRMISIIFNKPCRTIGLAITVALLVTPDLVAANAKKPEGAVIGPTGILGDFQPKWPKTPTEIVVTDIEKSSPADGSGLKVGDKIVGFGTQKFSRHPLWHIAEAVEISEGADGKLPLLLDSGKQVEIKLSAIGAYSPTAPYKCPKTDKIITQAADALVKDGLQGGATHTGILGLMATGEKKYLDVVSRAIHDGDLLDIDPKEVDAYLNGTTNSLGSSGWTWGYNVIALGEYYLLTRDEAVLPAIRTYSVGLARGQDGLGLWGHRMARGPKHRAPGYGVMNQPSLSNLIGMILAQKCGIKDPVLDKAVARTYSWYADLVGKGGLSYGSGGSYPDYFNNNGTSGSAAIIMSLKDNQKGAAYFSQIAATSYDSLTSGHASSFFNPLWTPLGASLSGPEVTQQFFKKSLWYFTCERDWQGRFRNVDGAGSVAGQALLMYCLPRKALLITGREADKSIYVTGSDVSEVILRSKINYEKKKTEELLELLHDSFIQVRRQAQKELAKRAGNGKTADVVTPAVLAVMKDGSEQKKLNALSYLEACHPDIQKPYAEWLGNVVRDGGEPLSVRVAASTILGGKAFGKSALPLYNDILKLVFEERNEPDPFRQVENDLSKALDGISKNAGAKPLDQEVTVDKTLLYKVANRFMDHPRQNVRQTGCDMIIGIPVEDFPIVAERLVYVLNNNSPDYHSYSQAINAPGITILADFNIKEGLDILLDAIYNGDGKWAFKYRALMETLPKYGGNAEPYIEKFEDHGNINRPGDRFTPQWQKVVKQIREDKNPPKLMTLEEVLRAAKQERSAAAE